MADEYRYPTVNLMFHSNADILTEWLASDLGERITADNVLSSVAPDLVDQILEGYTERINQFEWHASLNLQPYAPYRIAEIDLDDHDILGSDSATIAEDLDTTETGVDINAGDGPDWDHEVDYDIFIGGEQMAITAVSAMAGTFPNRTCTLTVIRSQNGVTKTHSSGAAITMAPPVYIGL